MRVLGRACDSLRNAGGFPGASLAIALGNGEVNTSDPYPRRLVPFLMDVLATAAKP